mmetsp:Transcript_18528/g.26662  ORF Transcript_18528/g.26662 Transcript_18528/m.26662 type:complete len:497 (+) Transcript_18528:97-1587(+)
MKVKLLTFAFYRSPNHAQVEGVKHLRSFLRERALQSGDNGGGDDICVAGSLSEECGAKNKDSCGLCSAYSLECGVNSECVEASPTVPTKAPTNNPTKSPTSSPTKSPTSSPTKSPTSSPTKSPTVVTCTDTICGNDIANTREPLQCDPSDLSLTILNNFEYTDGGVTDSLVKLLGPSDPALAAALVIAVPHGGSLKPDYIGDRTENDPTYCPSGGCRILADSYTKPIAETLANKFIQNYCKVPYLIINELHRSKMDANREIGEAAFGNAIAESAWTKFHEYINEAQSSIQTEFGTVTNTASIEGVRGLVFDVHGYSGTDWHNDGSDFIQWGYCLGKDSLDKNDITSSKTRGSFTHARQMPGESLECLVRGPKSLGQRFNEQLPLSLDSSETCGRGLPSLDYQDPKAVASDPTYCADNDGVCSYYSGGYDVKVHERMDWDNDPTFSGIHMNTVQAELPRCIRFATDETRNAVHEEFADKLSIALCSFMTDLFGSDIC